MKDANRPTLFARYARFFWLAVTLLVPFVAFGAYLLTPHEEIWHEIVYSLICVPLFVVWLLALLFSVISFLVHQAGRQRCQRRESS